MNYFFKYLLPQLMEYFNNDKETIKEFLPKVIEEKCSTLLLENDKEINNKNEIGKIILIVSFFSELRVKKYTPISSIKNIFCMIDIMNTILE